MSKHTCMEHVHARGGFYGYPCGKPAKFERDGKHYCGIHDPVAVKARQAKRDAEQKAKYARRAANNARYSANMREQEHRAECFPELLEALKEAKQQITALCTAGDVPDSVNAAISKATGEQV